MKILIATGIYPPDIGGPATYAKNVRDVWVNSGHEVKVATFGWKIRIPTGLRHFLFMFEVIWKARNANLIFVLDTWSAALPTMWACKLMGKRYLIRTGGDFLWESYLERTGEKVIFSDFYNNCAHKFNAKEKLVYRLTKKVLDSSRAIIFSTDWQKKIFESGYSLDKTKNSIVENHYSKPRTVSNPKNRNFLGSARSVVFKNLDLLKESFDLARPKILKSGYEDVTLDLEHYHHTQFMQVMEDSYVVILVSLGDISPNMIMEALRYGLPCIVTKENGINNRIGDYVILVDPLDKEDVSDKIVWLANPENREKQAKVAAEFNFSHSWDEIGQEILEIVREKGIIQS